MSPDRDRSRLPLRTLLQALTRDGHTFTEVRRPAAPLAELQDTELPLKGVRQREMAAHDGQYYPYMIIGLTDTKRFDRVGFRRVFAEIQGWDGNEDAQNYLVLSQAQGEKNVDGVFVFPGRINHNRFYEDLQSAGYAGEPQSAGHVSSLQIFFDYASSLENEGLNQAKSEAYQDEVLNRKFERK